MDLVAWGVVLVIAGIAAGIWQVMATSGRQQALTEALSQLPNFEVSHVYPGADGNNGIAIDESNAKVCLVSQEQGSVVPRVLDYDQLISSEIFENGQSVMKTSRGGQLGAAAVGGLVAGGVGAVVGALTSSKSETRNGFEDRRRLEYTILHHAEYSGSAN